MQYMWSATPFFIIYPKNAKHRFRKDLHIHVRCSTICNCQDLKTIQVFNRWMNKDVAFIHNRIVFCYKMKFCHLQLRDSTLWIKQSKVSQKKNLILSHLSDLIHMWNIKKQIKRTDKFLRNQTHKLFEELKLWKAESGKGCLLRGGGWGVQ